MKLIAPWRHNLVTAIAIFDLTVYGCLISYLLYCIALGVIKWFK